MEISLKKARDLALQVLLKHGFNQEESLIIANSLMWSQMRDTSQGLNKLFGWRIEKSPKSKELWVEKETKNSILVNSEMGSHIIACDFATKRILDSAVNEPVFIAGIKNTDNSAGALGYFTEQIANTGLVALMISAADPGVVIYGGKTPVLGTNPISIAVPTLENPILLDMSTAALTWGDLIKFNNESKPLPTGLAFDNQGSPTTDPKKAMEGAVTTFDKSYKSSGLALMIQILAGPLVGSVYSVDSDVCQYGSLIITINPTFFGDKDVFLNNIQKMIGEIKNSEPDSGFTKIQLPGDRGYQKTAESINKNTVTISEELFSKIQSFLT